MAKEKQTRPDASHVRAMMDTAVRIDGKYREIAESEQVQRGNAQRCAQLLREGRLRRELEEMDIEQINRSKQGIRVGLLRSAGVHTVWQVSLLSFQQICDIDGLGEQSAFKIRDTVKQIRQNTEENLRIRIDVDRPAREDSDLIRALYLLIHTGPLRARADSLYRDNHQGLQQDLVLARESLSGFGWLFKSRAKKDTILAGVNRLQLRLQGSFGDGKLITDWENLMQTPEDVCWADYCANAPAYFAQLEQLGLQWEKENAAPGGLPAQLAAEIEAQELDLKYLKATLRSYQTFGTKYIVHQKRSLLGDEMGLGKTIQAIAAMAALKAEGKHHFMVVCPASVLVNWCREIRKHSTLEVTKVHGDDPEALLHWRENGDVAVTTYESISRFQLPERFRICMVVTDEAHYVKNPETRRTKALLKLLQKTDYALFMSGTPLENRVEEMCFLTGCLQPELAKELEAVKFLSTAE